MKLLMYVIVDSYNILCIYIYVGFFRYKMYFVWIFEYISILLCLCIEIIYDL